MRFRSLAMLGVTLALAGTAACADNTGPNGAFEAGLYALTSVNGYTLPYSFTDQSTGGTTTLRSDVYTITGDGTYSEVISETVSNSYGTTPTTDSEQGTWIQNGGTITFSPTYSSFSSNLSPYSGSLANGGTLSGPSLLISSPLGQLVYERQ